MRDEWWGIDLILDLSLLMRSSKILLWAWGPIVIPRYLNCFPICIPDQIDEERGEVEKGVDERSLVLVMFIVSPVMGERDLMKLRVRRV